ncbi:hypothetical protein Plec18167_002790 [Paecilomyces lecythidis]|uniref:Uncharacterized protein n=1 Tax=Paecilomyces lecythidis TaxID=3004212 RepID=A0ABR3Y2Y9_9EURO
MNPTAVIKGQPQPDQDEMRPQPDGFQPMDLSEKSRKKWAAEPSKEYLPPSLQDLTIDNITPNVIAVNSNINDNPRLQYIITKLIQTSHDFVRDVDLSLRNGPQLGSF